MLAEPQRALGRWSAVLFAGVLITVLWAPIPFGSIEPWAVGILQVAALLLVAVWVLACGARGVVVAQRNPLQLLVMALAALAFVQSLAILPSGPTSVDPFSSRQAGTTIFALGCLFAVALVSIDSRRRVETAANALFWLAFCLSVLGILQSVSGAQKIYWFRETNGNLLFGPFPNKNHFAGLMELLLPLGLGMLATGAVPRQRRGLYLFGALVICIAVVLSRSRGGLLSLVAELVFLVAAAAFAFRSPRRGRSGNPAVVGVGALILAAAVAVGVYWVGADEVIASLADAQDTAVSDGAISRNAIWSDTLILVKSHPMVGTGIGAFGTAFASVTRSSGAAVVLHAHSDALQIVADAGAIGAGLAILFVAGLGFSARKGSRAEDPVLRGVALGAAAGCFGLFVHSWVDFNLQIPSNALAALFVAALMIRASGIDGVPVGLVPRSRT